MKRPYITIKFAQTLDGKIAAQQGSASRISGPLALRFAHRLRSRHDAVLVGIGTVLADNPQLTTRLVTGKNPVRVVLDSHLRIIPVPGTRILRNAKKDGVIIFATQKATKSKIKALKSRGVEVIIVPGCKRGNIDLTQILRILYKKGVKKLLVEGGSEIITSFIKKQLADKIVIITAPVIFGCGMPAARLNLKLKLKSVKRMGGDIACEFVPGRVSQ